MNARLVIPFLLFGSLVSAAPNADPAKPARPDQPTHFNVKTVTLPPDLIKPGPDGKARVDLSDVPGLGWRAKAKGLVAKGAKGKGAPVKVDGTWTWTTRNRNFAPVENTLHLTVAKNGKISGTLSDDLGDHPITAPTLNGDSLTFTVLFPSPGRPDVPFTYTVNLDSSDLKVAVERPDFSPEGKAAGRKLKREFAARHDAAK